MAETTNETEMTAEPELTVDTGIAAEPEAAAEPATPAEPEKKAPRPRRKRRTTLRPMEFLYRQIYDTNSNIVLGYDAELFFNDQKLGTMSYDDISGICDRANLASRIGKWQIVEVCEMLQRKNLAGKHIHRVFVTLSAKYISRPTFVSEFDAVLNKYEIPHKRFCIQITESQMHNAPKELLDNIRALRSEGTKFAVSEFGAESSALLKLSDFAVDYIKLDPGFAEDIDVNDRVAGVAESMIELADKLGYLVIATGVDTKEQLNAFTRMRCFLIEGNHFSVPEREDEAIH